MTMQNVPFLIHFSTHKNAAWIDYILPYISLCPMHYDIPVWLSFLLDLSSSMLQHFKVVFNVGNKYYIQSIVSKLQYKLKCIGIAIFNCKLNYKDECTQITNSLVLIAQCCNHWKKFRLRMLKSRNSTSCVLTLLNCGVRNRRRLPVHK